MEKVDYENDEKEEEVYDVRKVEEDREKQGQEDDKRRR